MPNRRSQGSRCSDADSSPKDAMRQPATKIDQQQFTFFVFKNESGYIFYVI